MDVNRAKQIYSSDSTIKVHLDDGDSVWIENVDEAKGMATVQVGGNPVNTKTVSVDRLQER
ncbi:H-type small acid-soluble spore protein [Paenibacillus lupini]|jgi:small acid-soluble spore protein H (minor)|uniref:H-type small acid-soluble spore protein n=1 Tax=Paenibacillus lupini TaxID=1450204 RepID=UPI00141EE018|nr:H-type small acid-soluble spore protein [Paenibacillus lupini]NIK24125.1 small acid-soluble spore protein H (minor) [Paenibacillus lupini]